MKKIFICGLLTMSLFSSYSLNAAETDVLNIPDEKFEACIKTNLGIDVDVDILISDTKEVTTLSCVGKSITSIEGVQHFLDLEDLSLINNKITDITPVMELTNLSMLNLSRNQIEDISIVNNLQSLTSLNIGVNQVSDISSLKNLTKLVSLDISNNKIIDLTPLSLLINLESIEAGGNVDLVDISPLSKLENLEYLWLIRTSVNDLEPLKDLSSLETLSICWTGIEDISAISNLENLVSLDISDNNISDISSLASNSNLVYLKADRNNIKDISVLSTANKLETLDMRSNQISDISPLANKPRLATASLSNQKITLEPIVTQENDLITSSVINILDEEVLVELGYPEYETASLSSLFNSSTNIPGGGIFSGTISVEATLINPPKLSANLKAEIDEENYLEDDQLIELFNVVQEDGKVIDVNDSNVDYSRPGTYNVIFSDEDGTTIDSELSVLDVLPSITVKENMKTVDYGSVIGDIITLFGISAMEVNENDLLDKIIIEHQVDTELSGSYPILISVSDQEGNVATETVNLVVNEQLKDEVKSEEEAEVKSKVEAEVKSEEEADVESEIENQKHTQMKLSNTGANDHLVIIILTMIIPVIVSIRRFNK